MIVCCDLDHTLRHAAWRDMSMPLDPRVDGCWDDYHKLGIEDQPCKTMISLLVALHNNGHQVYIVTAIPRKWKRQVFGYLHKHGILIDEDHLLMRADNAFRSSPEIKLELTGDLDVDLFIDDREDVSEAYANTGVTTLQVRLVS